MELKKSREWDGKPELHPRFGIQRTANFPFVSHPAHPDRGLFRTDLTPEQVKKGMIRKRIRPTIDCSDKHSYTYLEGALIRAGYAPSRNGGSVTVRIVRIHDEIIVYYNNR